MHAAIDTHFLAADCQRAGWPGDSCPNAFLGVAGEAGLQLYPLASVAYAGELGAS